jgi:D-alanine-D-alanine ligase
LNYNVKLIDPGYGFDQPKNTDDYFNIDDFSEVSSKNVLKVLSSDYFDNTDLVFIALHGKGGEDGFIQSILELKGLSYTGSDVLASALAMDKNASKMMFQYNNILTPKWITVESKMMDFNRIESQMESNFQYPLVVKPNDSGSTLGLTICNSEDDLYNAIDLAGKYSEKILIEEYISGKEMTVGILGNEVLPVLEIVPKYGFYDYENKYVDGRTDYFVPADIPERIAQNLQNQSLKAFKTLGLKTYGRVDIRMTNQFENYCLEVNSLPGMTSHSLFPMMAKASGIEFDHLIEKIVNLSLGNE